MVHKGWSSETRPLWMPADTGQTSVIDMITAPSERKKNEAQDAFWSEETLPCKARWQNQTSEDEQAPHFDEEIVKA